MSEICVEHVLLFFAAETGESEAIVVRDDVIWKVLAVKECSSMANGGCSAVKVSKNQELLALCGGAAGAEIFVEVVFCILTRELRRRIN